MNSKSLRKRLSKMDCTLGRDIFGWIVISNWSKFEWRFPTLGGVDRFITDEENLAKYAEKNKA